MLIAEIWGLTKTEGATGVWFARTLQSCLYSAIGYASCDYATIGVATPCPTNNFVAYYIVYRSGVNSTCFPVSIGCFSATPVSCS
jgi:hypothetical protein